MKVRPYFTLAVRTHFEALDGTKTSVWSAEFGDYDKEVVESERDDWLDSVWREPAPKAGDLKIVRSDSTQDSINAAIAKLNAKEK
jgi:hypothetical protein